LTTLAVTLVLAAGAVEPRATRVPADRLARVVAEVPPSTCRDLVVAELAEGRHSQARCEATRARATQAAARVRGSGRHPGFGVVEARRVELDRVHLVLSHATHCTSWPLISGDAHVLRLHEATLAGCRIRRYEGRLSVVAVDTTGRRVGLPAVASDADGRVELSVPRLVWALRDAGLEPEHVRRLELGAEAWAGALDLARLRALAGAWHAAWVARGRGASAVLSARPGLHPSDAQGAAALAVEAMLVREERDLRRVLAQTLEPATFLARHPRSPYAPAARAFAARSEHVAEPQRSPEAPLLERVREPEASAR
jgi:hypothetical protein